MAVKHSEMKKEKEEAERKVGALSSTVESLQEELRKERNISRATRESAQRAIKERAVISRAVQSFGCKVNFTKNGDCTLEVEDGPHKCFHSIPEKQSEKNTTNVSESISSVSEKKFVKHCVCCIQRKELVDGLMRVVVLRPGANLLGYKQTMKHLILWNFNNLACFCLKVSKGLIHVGF